MTLLVPIMLFGWVPFTILVFKFVEPHKAVLYSAIGGALFLPTTGYSIPGLPDYDKTTAIALGLICGAIFSDIRKVTNFQWKKYDLPMLIYCIVPLTSSLMNGLGAYEGFSGVLDHVFFLGIPYLAGRMYFSSIDSIRGLCIAIVAGGLIYIPLCWYEIRMSPQLSNIFYGFFPHSFAQQFRYGGFRPVVFMYHGLMVAQWMAIATVTSFWLWRIGELKKFKSVPMFIWVVLLITTTIYCKSFNGLIILSLGVVLYFLYKTFNTRLLLVLVLILAAYPFCRITGFVSKDSITSFVGMAVDETREGSLGYRLQQEDVFIQKIMQRSLLGWSRMGRAWPRDEDGRKETEVIDSFWLMIFAVNGFIGLFAFYATLFVGPWFTSRAPPSHSSWHDERVVLPAVISLGVLLFALDTFVNAMPNPIYFVMTGALVSFNLTNRREADSNTR
jgi:hypothetical protein